MTDLAKITLQCNGRNYSHLHDNLKWQPREFAMRGQYNRVRGWRVIGDNLAEMFPKYKSIKGKYPDMLKIQKCDFDLHGMEFEVDDCIFIVEYSGTCDDGCKEYFVTPALPHEAIEISLIMYNR